MKKPQPFFRKQTQAWYVQVGKRQIPLGKDEAKAWDEYHKIMAGQRTLTPAETIGVILDEFLEWVKKNREPQTYASYHRHLDSFFRFVGPRLTAADLRPLHVTRWIAAEYSTCGDTTRNTAISAVQRAMNWAVKQGVLDRSPLYGIEKPARNRRETFITPEQFELIYAAARGKPFRELLTVLWETGCRPQEARKVEARHYIADRGIWLFERLESKGKRKRRIVVLTEGAAEITARQAKLHPLGPILRNQDGKPWTKNALFCRFRHLSKKLGFPIHAYAFRHGFATVALRRGVDAFSVAKLMGHSDTKMLEWVYQHVDSDDDFLRGALNRANGENP